jgi:hypothetical protein
MNDTKGLEIFLCPMTNITGHNFLNFEGIFGSITSDLLNPRLIIYVINLQHRSLNLE